MKSIVVFVLLYGIFTLAGGVLGYLKAGSLASLIGGGTTGILLIVCSYGILKGVRAAVYVALAVAILLGLRFFGVWLEHGRWMPDLTMVLLSLITVVGILWGLLKRR